MAALGFDPEWLGLREPFDEVALDQAAIGQVRAWAASLPARPGLRMVDLGSGTGVALRRAAGWLGARSVEAWAVDADAQMLAAAPAAWARAGAEVRSPADEGRPGSPADGNRPFEARLGGCRAHVRPLLADVLLPLDLAGGPPDGSVDLVLGHALADLLPLDRLSERVQALLRPGGLAHLALTYDGETSFEPIDDRPLEARMMAAFHRHMDRRRAAEPAYGGSTAGRLLLEHARRAGLEVVRAAPSTWLVHASDGAAAQALLNRMLDFVVGSLRELGEPPAEVLQRWEAARRAQLAAGRLRLRVRHLDLLLCAVFRP